MNYTSFAKDVVLKFLQDAFSQEDFYEDPNFQPESLEELSQPESPLDPNDPETRIAMVNEFLWKEDQDETQIFIGDSYTENLEKPEPKPALILTRGDIRWMNTSIDQMEQQSFGTGDRTYLDLIQSDITINCFSRNGLQAELLANIVFQSVQFFARRLRERTRIFEINSVVLGRESIVQSDAKIDLMVVPVGIGLYWSDRWRLFQLNPQVVEKADLSFIVGNLTQDAAVCPVRQK